jgi:hypothetical protein
MAERVRACDITNRWLAQCNQSAALVDRFHERSRPQRGPGTQ